MTISKVVLRSRRIRMEREPESEAINQSCELDQSCLFKIL